nr:restriction endonuclease [Sphingomonas kaistensis]
MIDGHHYLRAGQVVGVLAAPGCSLEILPKVDPQIDEAGESIRTVRSRLVQMLHVALGLEPSTGAAAPHARQNETLLDVFIRQFADGLLAEVRRSLPRQYEPCRDDLPALRGRLDVIRQFTIHAVRPERLACSFDALLSDTPLMRIMAACVRELSRYCTRLETQRKLSELRSLLSEITEVSVRSLPWSAVTIDRTNYRWKTLLRLARLLLGREWQSTGHREGSPDGLALLFPMNDLFEAYVAALLRRAMAGTDIEVVEQGGLRYCLGRWDADESCVGTVFQTRPDILLRDTSGRTKAIIDTKWKKLSPDPLDRKHGISQADVYQMMAYARIYECAELMLLYPDHSGLSISEGAQRVFGMSGGLERMQIRTIDVTQTHSDVTKQLAAAMMSLSPG